MPENNNKTKPEGGGSGGGGQFEAFLRAVQAFIPLWCEQVRSQSTEKDREAVMRLYEEGILNAWIGAAEELTQLYQRLDREGRAELDRAMAISGMLTLVQNAASLASRSGLSSPAAALDLGGIIEKIKWFILCILDCLGIEIPCILKCLLALIDNFFRLFVGPVSREYADYYFDLEKKASEVRLQMLREQKMRKGCSCGNNDGT